MLRSPLTATSARPAATRFSGASFKRLAFSLALLWGCLIAPRTALAFAWTIRDSYARCTPCHVDPSGGGILTSYGRALAEETIRMRFSGEPEGGGEVAPSAEFLWGLKPPEPLMLQGELRYLHLEQKVEGAPSMARNIWMQADFEAALALEHFVVSASIGYAHEGSLPAALTRAPEKNLVSRYHWLGYSLFDDALLLRAGRMNLPFGLRSIEHTLWARARTRTSINADQQYGVSASYADQRFRAELMAIAGNVQLRPDNFRERGYSGYFEWAAQPKLTVGASSLIVHRSLDPSTLRETWRHAHGLFGRWATNWEPLVVLTEWNFALQSPRGASWRRGFVGYLQADVEVYQGIHLIGTGEAENIGGPGQPLTWGTWLSYAWFFAPHADLRVDSIYQHFGSSEGSTSALSLLVQAHLYL
jgi:hypothetical protein